MTYRTSDLMDFDVVEVQPLQMAVQCALCLVFVVDDLTEGRGSFVDDVLGACVAHRQDCRPVEDVVESL